MEEEEGYEAPGFNEWVLCVDSWGQVHVVKHPNIHFSFLETRNAEEIGLPYEVKDRKPGVYRVVTKFKKSTDWETGLVDDYSFDPASWELLWGLSDGA